MVATLISLALFQTLYENERIEEVMSLTVGSEKRIYGRTVNDTLTSAMNTKTVYAVVP